MGKRTQWKMALGWLCYTILVRLSLPVRVDSKLGAFIISWAGYYAYPPDEVEERL